MAEVDEVRTLLDAGAAGVEMQEWTADSADTPDAVGAVVPQGYSLAVKSLEGELARLRRYPRRVTGTAVVSDTASWLAYFGKHRSVSGDGDGATCHSEVYGDVTAGTVTGILNAPMGPDDPAWGDHRVVLQLQHSAAWTAWIALDGKLQGQTAFAEHIENRAPDFVNPDAASMLEIAQTFQQNTGVKFESSARLDNGQTRFQYFETVESKAGTRGQIDVPSKFDIRLQPWRGVAIVVPLTARLRSRATPDGLRLAYVLDRVDDVLDAAWQSLLGELTDTLPVPVLAGRAPSYAG